MSSCHGLTRVNGTIIGDPLEIKMFESTGWSLEEEFTNKFDGIVLAVINPPNNN
jgi:cation-transporting ATPase 13A2